MSFSKIINTAMELLKIVSSADLANETSFKSWMSVDGTFVVATDGASYSNVLESLASANLKIASRFSRKTIYKFIEERLPRLKRSGQLPESSEIFLKSF